MIKKPVSLYIYYMGTSTGNTKAKRQSIAPSGSSGQANSTTVGADVIYIKGARVHNLKNIDVSIPRNRLVVVTGVSGSGKSSLTIDTLFAEGQRRYAESLSAYARQFMARMDKPDVDYIKGLCPAIAIEQKVITRTPRSTVGSMTEIYDYLRLLFARAGKTYSPVSGRIVKKDDVSDVVNTISAQKAGDRVLLLTPFRQHRNRDTREELNILLQKGFSRLYVPAGGAMGETLRIEDLLAMDDKALRTRLPPPAEPKKTVKGADSRGPAIQTPGVSILVDRLVVKPFDEDDLHRIADSVGTAFYEGEGEMQLEINGEKSLAFSNRFELDGITFELTQGELGSLVGADTDTIGKAVRQLRARQVIRTGYGRIGIRDLQELKDVAQLLD